MAEYLKAAHCNDVPDGEGVVSEMGGKSIAVFNVGGEFFAIGNICPHRGGPLGEGELNGSIVTCPWHGWEFDVRTGCNQENEKVRVSVFETRIEGNHLLVKV